MKISLGEIGNRLCTFLTENGRSTRINGEYCARLLHKLRNEIKDKKRGILCRGIHLLHEDVPVHSVIVVKEEVKICGFTELEHPPYIADLAPSDYYLLSKLKSDLRGKRFNVDDAVIRAATEHFEDKVSD